MELKFVARQAILDEQSTTIGYELLFRDSLTNAFSESNNDKATSQVIIQNHLLGNLSQICAGKKAFINFHDNSILQKFPLMFDKEMIVVELLETLNISNEIIDVVAELHQKGYTIALDDYDFLPKWDVFFPYISIIKLDLEETSYSDITQLKVKLDNLKLDIKLLVERVETFEQYQKLKSLGVNYFQGYYFHKPELKSGKSISPLKTNLLRLCAEVYKTDTEFNEISKIVSQDVSLASGILKLVNSAGTVEITSVKQAVSFLGLEKIKQYVAIISMSQLSSDSPNELFAESLVRAKTMESLSLLPPFQSISHLGFITGLLSNLDAILQVEMKRLTNDLPIAPEIKQALLGNETLLTELLVLGKYFETKQPLDSVLTIMEKYDISFDSVLDAYQDSLEWYSLTMC
tara:strand:+ start:12094 stop:13305 length:1212 start_codon:yes stop_codon:yes gene_type:complete